MLAAPALAGEDGTGLANRNVNMDPRTRFPAGAASADSAGGLGFHVGGRLSRSTARDHPATAANSTGWGGTTAVPARGPIDPLANGARSVAPGRGRP